MKPGGTTLVCGAFALAFCMAAGGVRAAARTGVQESDGSSGCLACHEGIEAMHPEAELSCVDCHGGDASATKKFEAHVQPRRRPAADERVAGRDDDPAWRRFMNPMDLRVADVTCGGCHTDLVHDLRTSLHGTTAGHLSDGFYEMGLRERRGSAFGVFPVLEREVRVPGGEVESLLQAPAFDPMGPEDELATHYPDLVRKECMQCHLYSRGQALRGRVGFDGDYRGEGCAACHVNYAVGGLSDTADPTVRRTEPGHPLRHEMTRAPRTETCTSCHQGDASIGLNFRGLAQLPPGAAGGPDVPGTTDSPLHRRFHLDDPSVVLPDVHHERGMHCIDCHTLGDVMGDGRLHGQMEHAVEISCEACHGSFEERSSLRTQRGTPLEHLYRDGARVFLRSKVTGEVHEVPQVPDVLDPASERYNARAAEAMTGDHGQLECYTCHSGWNPNFLGFHFYRNAALSQLDLVSGGRSAGRVTTQDKVFATWKSFFAGLNEAGRIAPYLTGFSTMGSVDDEDGVRILDQALPETAAGLSGLSMVHHQMHTVRPTARSCVECHRTSSTWGMGSSNFRLSRQLLFAADRRGIEVVLFDRANPTASLALTKIVQPDVTAMVLDCDPLQGHARYLYAAEGQRGIHVFDVRDPRQPERVAFVASASPRGMQLAGRWLYSADGVGGLRIYDVSDPARIALVGVAPMFDAHDVTLSWPWAYVADGPGGLAIVDVRAPIAPRFVAGLPSATAPSTKSRAIDVEVLFQYSRPSAPATEGDSQGEGQPPRAESRTVARALCALLDGDGGLVLCDVTEPTRPLRLHPATEAGTRAVRADQELEYRGLALLSHVDLAGSQGGLLTRERDYVYVVEELRLRNGNSNSYLRVLDVSDPSQVERIARVRAGNTSEMLVPLSVYNPPFLQRLLITPGSTGLFGLDVSVSSAPTSLGVLSAVSDSWVVAVEEFPLDRMIDVDGRRLKDVSHDGSRWLLRAEIERVLDVSAAQLGLDGDDLPEVPGHAARSYFRRHDADRDGLLSGQELEDAGGSRSDRNGDGRATLDEIGELGAAFGRRSEARVPEARAGDFASRTRPDGDLARLLDGVDPSDFDRAGDRRLDANELTAAVFHALDLDADGRLDFDELSRSPGLRHLRYGDVDTIDRAGRRDLRRGDSIALRDFRLRPEELAALDPDQDGFVRLAFEPTPEERRNGLFADAGEWPRRRIRRSGLPPGVSAEAILAAFDRNRDRELTRRELARRPDLYIELDGDADGSATQGEITRHLARIADEGIELVPDGFLARWDLDGDRKLTDTELFPEARKLLEERALAARGGSRGR